MSYYAGFDCYAHPGDETMAWFLANTSLVWCGYYLAPAPSHQETSWMGTRAALRQAGWGIAPLYLGEQVIPPGSQHPSADKGATDGADAAALMTSEGFPAGSYVYLDLEDGSLPQALSDYTASWCDAVQLAGYQPGVYCSHVIADAVAALRPAARIWAFKVPTTDPHDITTPFPSPDPAGSGYAAAYAWQRDQHGNFQVPLDSPYTLEMDLDTALDPNPGGPVVIADQALIARVSRQPKRHRTRQP